VRSKSLYAGQVIEQHRRLHLMFILMAGFAAALSGPATKPFEPAMSRILP
jgi:hypothetical protein